MRDIATLMRAPGLAHILIAQLAARFPAGMYSLGILMHVRATQGSYTAAGLVLAAFSIGMAVAGPVVSRLLSRLGTFRVLTATLLISVTAFALLALLPLPLAGAMALAGLGGAAMPPVIPAVRTLYPQLAPQHLLTGLFSLDAALQEIIWIIGPVAITLLVGTLGSGPALLVVIGIQIVGGLLFILARRVRQLRIPPTTRRFGRVLANPSVLLMTVTSLLMIKAFAAMEAAIVASFGDGSVQAGGVLALSAVGSLMGGLAAGNRPISRWSLALRMLVVVAGFGLAAILSGFWGLALALFLAGFGIAPALAAVSSVIAGSVPFSDTAEAYGWIGTGQLLGASVGSALAGIAIDAGGGHAGILVAVAIAGSAALVALVFRDAQPDLRGGIVAVREG